MKTYGDFPEIIREVIKLRVGPKYNHGTKSTANIADYSFDWKDSPEGFDFWDKILRQERNEVFFDKYPLRSSLYPCNKHDKCIASVDIAFEGVDIKRGTVLNNSSGHLSHRLCDYNRYMKQFNSSLSKQEDNSFNIDYSKQDWWKILEKGDEVVVCDVVSSINKNWSSKIKIGDVISILQDDIDEIQNNNQVVCLQNNKYGVNFTYNMVKLHKKKNKQLNNINTHDVSGDSSTVLQGLGNTGFKLQGQTCQITTGSRLIGTRKSIGRSQAKTCTGLLKPLQHSIYS